MTKFLKLKKRLSEISLIEKFILITFAFLVIFLIKFFGIKEEWRTIKVQIIKKNWSENYDMYGYRTPFWLSDKIKKGQIEKGKNGKTIAELIDFESYERGSEESELFLTVKIKVNINKRTNVILFKDMEVNLGSQIELNLDNNLIIGQVIDNNIPSNGYPSKFFIVTTRWKNIEPNLFNKITLHDKFVNRANSGTAAEILEVALENPSSNIILNGSWLAYNSKMKDVVIKFKVKAFYRDNRWYFANNQNLKIGSSFYFYGEKMNLYSLLIEDFRDE